MSHNCYLNLLFFHIKTLWLLVQVFWLTFLLNSKESLPDSLQHVSTCPWPSSQISPPFPHKASWIPWGATLWWIMHTYHSLPFPVLREWRKESCCCVYSSFNYCHYTIAETEMCHYSPLNHKENLLYTTVPCMKVVLSISVGYFLCNDTRNCFCPLTISIFLQILDTR